MRGNIDFNFFSYILSNFSTLIGVLISDLHSSNIKTLNKYCTYEPYLGINFGNMKNVKKIFYKIIKCEEIYIKLYIKHR